MGRTGLVLGLLAVLAAPAGAQELERKIKSFDGYELEARAALPPGVEAGQVKRAIVLLHGSGPQSMDLDLTEAGRDKTKKNLVFCDVRDVLVPQGFAVVRYHKRSWQVRQALLKDRSYAQTPAFKVYAEAYLRYFVEDAKAAAKHAREWFPGAAIYYLGASEGTYVGLQAARELPGLIKGVALWGFFASSGSAILLEQIVYRQLAYFSRLDQDRDGFLTSKELAAAGQDRVAWQLAMQMKALDQDGDGRISLDEFKAAQFSNLLAGDILGKGWHAPEAAYPPVAEILADAKFRVAFFQGLWDNQTPAYHALAVQYLNQHRWKNASLKFWFFPKLGHGLDPRDSYEDVLYRPADPAALKTLAEALAEHFPAAK